MQNTDIKVPVAFVCEPECKGLDHIDFNSEFLRTLLNAGYRVSFLGDRRHIRILQEKLKNICYKEKLYYIASPLVPLHVFFPIRILFDTRFLWQVFKKAKHQNATKLVFLSCNQTNLYVIKLFSLLFRSLRVDVVIHGILEEVATGHPYWGYRNPINLFTRIPFWFGFALQTKTTRRCRLIVLAPWIKNEIKRIFPRLEENIDFIYHPVPLNQKDIYPTIKKKKISICWIGILNSLKGGDAFNEIVSRITSRKDINIEFHLLGFVNDVRFTIHRNVILHGSLHEFLPESVMKKLAPQMDYAILTYPIDSYKLTASGAFATALGYDLPVICLKNRYFSSFFEEFGDIGYIFESVDEIIDLLVEHQEELLKKHDAFLVAIEETRRAINEFNKSKL